MLYLLCPLASAIIYPVGSLFLKRSINEGGGLIRSLFISNIILTLCFTPLIVFLDAPPDWTQWFWPILAGCCFFLGQLFTLIAIQSGDVSVQTPLMGMKLIFVAVLSSFIRPEDVPPLLWGGAIISTFAIFLISGGNFGAFRRSSRTVVLSLIACVAFACTDILSSYRSGLFGQIPFILGTAMTIAILSLGLIPFFRARVRDTPRPAMRLLAIGSLAIGLQALILITSLTQFGQATAINIIYSSRALFGVLLVIVLGAWLGNHESATAGKKIMRNRLLGSLLLCVAIALVFLKKAVA
ncbi:MAG: drug/metabolite transporter (DMT)-like permease [Verrucomicrobiales bacterium]|jgi:drug/metabolite transporter (DMT)-like permease